MEFKKNKTTSIAKKVITFVILINLFVSIIILLFQIKKDREDFDASLKERFENLKRGTTTLGVDIYGEDEPKVMSFLKGLIAQDDFSYTFISEPDDKDEIIRVTCLKNKFTREPLGHWYIEFNSKEAA